MTISEFTKEDNKGALSLSTRKAIVFSCIDRKNLYDILLEDAERGAISHLSGDEKINTLKLVQEAREINDMNKCLEEQAHSALIKARESYDHAVKLKR